MRFIDPSLAARIERAEADLAASAIGRVARRAGGERAFVRPLAGGMATYGEPSSPLNKVVGAGFGELPDEGALDELEREYAARDCAVQFEVSTLASPELGALLTRRGYVYVGFENVLGLELRSERSTLPPPGVSVTVSPAAELETWLDVVATGFASPDVQGVPTHESFDRDALRRVMRDFASGETVVRYLARRGGQLAGGGTVNLFRGIAQLCGAATLPEHRRHGVQSALLARRLADCARAGCELAVVTTQPGSKSQQNVERHDFRLLYGRAVLTRKPN